MAATRNLALAAAAVAIAALLAWRLVRPDARDLPGSGAAVQPPAPAGPVPGEPGLAVAPTPAVGTAPPPAVTPAFPPAPAAEGPRIRGRVVDGAGSPVGQAAVWLDGDLPWRGVASVASAGDGSYEIPAAEGVHVVQARAPHRSTARVEVTVATGAVDAAAPDLVLTEGATIRGRVLDAQGRPAAAVRVKGYAKGGVQRVLDTVWEGKALHFGMDDVVTGEDGTFVLSGLEAGVPHVVWLELYLSPDYRGDPVEHTGVMPDAEPLEFRILPVNAIAGVVLDARTNRPVPRFTVNGRVVRDPDGRFVVPAGVGGRIEVRARGYGPEAQENPATREGDRPPALVFRLAPDPDAGSLLLVVRDDEGDPVPHVQVRSFGADFSVWDDDLAEPSGEFRITGVPAGVLRGSVTAAGHGLADLDVVVPVGNEARVEVRLARSSPVRLRVLDARRNVARSVRLTIADAAGAGPAWRWVYARPQGTALPVTERSVFAATPPAEMSLSEAEGRIEGLAPGKYVLRVRMEEVTREVRFDVLPGKAGDLEVALGT